MPTLLIRGPDGTLVERELEGRLTVGCDEDNDLVLRNGGVEKRHANFFADGGEVVLEELGLSSAKKRLKPGVRVLIGGYEVSVKPGEQQLSVRRVPQASDTVVPDDAPTSFPFKPVLAFFAIALAAIVGAGLWKRLDREPPAQSLPAVDTNGCPDLEKDLQIARSATTQQALDAATRAADCDPLNTEALELKRSLRKELDAQAQLTRAKEFIDLERDEQALEQLEKLPSGTEAARAALPLLHEVAGRVLKQAKQDCDTYTKAGKKTLAEPRCAEAARLTKLVAPPPVAGAKAQPLSERVGARLHEPLLAEPVMLYAQGRLAEAVTKLQAVRERNDKAALHAQADTLRKNISNADGLYKVGAHALEKGDLDRGAKAFRDALELDTKVLPEGESVLKKNIEQQLSAKAYELGAVQAQHQAWPKACALWKTGFSFSRGNTELNTALTRDCTERARQLAQSDSCKDVDEALALAVPGDDLEPQLKERKAALRCR